jgi:hypothetical protein
MMWSSKAKRVLRFRATTLLLVLLALTGCVEVQVVDTTPAIVAPEALTSPQPVSSPEHNLAVLAVDFDPPLSYQQLIARRQSVALLVAIENMGSSTERNVKVQAQLSSPEDPHLLLAQEAAVSDIAPGELQIVRLAPLGEIPVLGTYRLEVMVVPADGEQDLSDNRKAFDIQIHRD